MISPWINFGSRPCEECGAIPGNEHAPVCATRPPSSAVEHPSHYGGKDNVYETIKVIEAWGLNFNLGNTVKYISRADRKRAPIEDLEKARFYLDREIANRKART